MTNDVVVRSASVDDVVALVELVREYWTFEGIDGFDPARVAGLLRNLLETPALGRAWIALVAGNAAGYLVASTVFSLEHGGFTAEIDELFVEGAHRNAGIGHALVARAEATLGEAGFTGLALDVAATNRRARVFYEARGFEGRRGYERLERKLPSHPALRAAGN